MYSGRSNRVRSITRLRNFAMYKQRSPIHESRYTQLAFTKDA